MDAEPPADAGAAAGDEGATVSARNSASTGAREEEVKVTLRLPKGTAAVLAERAQAAGLARGTYVATVLEGLPAPSYPRDHDDCVYALGLSTDGLASIAKDLKELVRRDSPESTSDSIDLGLGSRPVDVLLDHLRLASQLLGQLRLEALQRSRSLQTVRRTQQT